MIPKEILDEIRQKTEITSIISEHVALKKRGKNFLGLCPFHSEKTPSFTVSPDKQLFHCFGCGEGGNVFGFLMKLENISFVEAAIELAGRLGIHLEKTSPLKSGASDKEKLFELNSLAAKFFQQQLLAPAGKEARNYLRERGLSEQTAQLFGLGYAPEGRDLLFQHLISRGVAPALIETVGLTLPREGNDSYCDRFRQRLIFPICDPRGRVIGFSGRALGDREPKYLNSPETPIYRKSASVFGIHLSKESIKKAGLVILVEGNIDLVALYQAGITNVAASLGTALTVEQAKILNRFAANALLVFDGDSAGLAAAQRGGELLRENGFKVKVASLPEGFKDPDELIKKSGVAAFQKVCQSALPLLEFQIRLIIQRHKLEEIEERAAALRQIGALLGKEQDSFTQQEYARLAARALRLDQETVLNEIKRQLFYQGKSSGRDQRRVTTKPPSRASEAEKRLVALAASDQTYLEKIKNELTPEDFSLPEAAAIFKLLYSSAAAELDQPVSWLLDNLSDEKVKNFLTAVLVGEKLTNQEIVLQDCIRTIKEEQQKNRLNWLKNQLVEAERSGDTDKAAELLTLLKNEIP